MIFRAINENPSDLIIGFKGFRTRKLIEKNGCFECYKELEPRIVMLKNVNFGNSIINPLCKVS